MRKKITYPVFIELKKIKCLIFLQVKNSNFTSSVKNFKTCWAIFFMKKLLWHFFEILIFFYQNKYMFGNIWYVIGNRKKSWNKICEKLIYFGIRFKKKNHKSSLFWFKNLSSPGSALGKKNPKTISHSFKYLWVLQCFKKSLSLHSRPKVRFREYFVYFRMKQKSKKN